MMQKNKAWLELNKQVNDSQDNFSKPKWEDGSSKGSAILYKIGYRGGGLGKQGKGIVNPIGVRLRPQGQGLGYNNFKEQTRDTLVDFDGSLNDKIGNDEDDDDENSIKSILKKEEEEEKREYKSWSKRKKPKKKSTLYKTMEEMNKIKKTDTIIDMRDGVGKIYDPNQQNINQQQTKMDPRSKYCTELQYNTRLLVDLVNSEIQTTASKIKYKEDSLIQYSKKQEKIQKQIKNCDNKIEITEKIFNLLSKAQEKLEKNSFSLENLITLFKMIKTKYSNEYYELNISSLIIPMIIPYFQRYIKSCDPILNPNQLKEILNKWRDLFYDEDDEDDAHTLSKENQSIYFLLIDDILVPRIRSVLTSSWNIQNSEIIVHSLKLWKSFFSSSSFQSLINQCIIPRLNLFLSDWNVTKQANDYHCLFLPWFSSFSNELQVLLTTIRQKISKLISNLNILDEISHSIIVLWFEILQIDNQYDYLSKRIILPSLHDSFLSFSINQSLDHNSNLFRSIIRWRDVIDVDEIVSLLEECFFPQFLKFIKMKLEEKNYKEINQWYIYWKSSFPEMMKENPKVIYNFHEALLLIQSHFS